MTLNKIYEEVADEMGIDVEVVKSAYLSQWQFIKNTIEALPIKDNITEEEFNKLRTNFNIPSLGKLYTNYEKIQRARRRLIYLKELMNVKGKENKA